MRFSEQWLREWVNPNVATEALVSTLTMAGLEVDSVEPAAASFDQVVVGKVLATKPHPNAKKLTLCEVSIGNDALLQIVCGAKNVRSDLLVAVALEGAVLPNGLTIKAAEIRGEPSSGMLCAESELGMSEDASDGIMELSTDAPVGSSFRDYMMLDDQVIDVDLTPNRGDCCSILGIAREVGTLTKTDLLSHDAREIPPSNQLTVDVQIQAPDACPRYVSRVISDVDTSKASPVWMQERLRRSGIRSIDLVVDITNYVMLELGQPMHAFDLDCVEQCIKVRFAEEAETLTLLDGSEIKLSADSLVIADDRAPLALAGIMGGERSGVTAGKTKSILLESAYFDPIMIAGKARRYGLQTDSSFRFERGVDFELQKRAIERATALVLEFGGGQAGPVQDIQQVATVPTLPLISLRSAKVSSVLGFDIDAVTTKDILERLGFRVNEVSQGWEVEASSYRFDVRTEVDLIEELGRVFGYDNIPMSTSISSSQESLAPIESTEPVSMARINANLIANGFYEVINYSFVEPSLEQALNPAGQPVMLSNPLSADLSAMRTSIWPGLIKTAQHNVNRQQTRLRIFESGLVFVRPPSSNNEQESEVGLDQIPRLAGLMAGAVQPEAWCNETRMVDFFDVKGVVESLLSMGEKSGVVRFESAVHPALHPGQSAQIVLDTGDGACSSIGWVGALHPTLEKKLGFSGKVGGKIYLFDLSLNTVRYGKLPGFKALSKFPEVSRDLAFIVDSDLPSSKLIQEIERLGGEWLVDNTIFDLFSGESIGQGKKSIGVRLTLQEPDRTLKDQEVNQWLNDIVDGLKASFNVILRE